MAKQSYGILDGYRGTIGTVIGYQWRGKWCLRARPRQVRNPRTEAQQEHRMLFRDMVQLAGKMKQALQTGLHLASLDEQMTECNLFVKINKGRFTPQGVDYGALEISRGPVAPVAFTAAAVDERNVLHASFEKNPLHLRADNMDEVRVYAYCPALQEGKLSVPVFRRDRQLAMALPDEWAGLEVHFYAFVQDYKKQTSQTIFIEGRMEKGEVRMENGEMKREHPEGDLSTLKREKNVAKKGEMRRETKTIVRYETNSYTSINVADGGDGRGTADGDGLSMEKGREDGAADTRRRGAGGTSADLGVARTDAAAVRRAGRRR